MSSEFLLDYLPSFYTTTFLDENGNNLLLPIFDLQKKLYDDCLYQAIQIRQEMSFEKCPFFIHETNITIDTTLENQHTFQGVTGYKVDPEVIWIDTPYYDANMTLPLANVILNYDSYNNVKFVVFESGTVFTNTQRCVFVRNCYKDKKLLNKVYGELLNYNKDILNVNNESYVFTLDLQTITSNYMAYRQQLLALMYGLTMGPTITVMNNALGMFLLYTFSTMDGVVKDITSNVITVESSSDKTLRSYTTNTTDPGLSVGSLVEKYQCLDYPSFYLYDMYSQPARFTQALLANAPYNILTKLFYLDLSANEKWAYLNWDNPNIFWDNSNLGWDMGNNINCPLPNGSETSYLQPYTGNLITQFVNGSDNWWDNRYTDINNSIQPVYEMFRNVAILEYDGIRNNIDDIKYLINRIKPTYTKIVYINYGTPTTYGGIDFPQDTTVKLLVNMNLGDIVNENLVYYNDKYINAIWQTDYLNTTPVKVGDYTSMLGAGESAKFIGVSTTHLYLVGNGNSASFLSLELGGDITAWNGFNELSYTVKNLVVLNNNNIYLIEAGASTTTLHHYNHTLPDMINDNNIILTGTYRNAKKDYKDGNILSVLTEHTDGQYEVNIFQGGGLLHNIVIPHHSPYDNYMNDFYLPVDLSFTQFNFPMDAVNPVHDVLYILCKDSTSSYFFFRTIDLMLKTESIDPEIILNGNIQIDTHHSGYQHIFNYATRGPYFTDLGITNFNGVGGEGGEGGEV